MAKKMKYAPRYLTSTGINSMQYLKHQLTPNSMVPYPAKYFKPTLISNTLCRYQLHTETMTETSITATYMDSRYDNCDRCLKYHTNKCKECSRTKKEKSKLKDIVPERDFLTGGTKKNIVSLKNHSREFPGEWKLTKISSSDYGIIQTVKFECTKLPMPNIVPFLK